jgi:membrane associated rhomboid family serine protease
MSERVPERATSGPPGPGDRRRRGASRPRVALPRSAPALLALALAAVFLRTALASGADAPMVIDPGVLVAHGALAGEGGPWWRAATSLFLHGGAIHLLLAVVSLLVVAPFVEEQYGRRLLVPLFLGLGVIAALASRALGDATDLSVGATGATLGLVGAVAGAAHRRGTRRDATTRNEMLLWSIFVVFFGFVAGADLAGHAVGLAAGAAFGLAVRPARLERGAGATVALALAATGALAAGLAALTALVPLAGPP